MRHTTWLAIAAVTAAICAASVLLTDETGLACAQYGPGARCLSEGDHVTLTLTKIPRGLDGSTASRAYTVDRSRAVYARDITLSEGWQTARGDQAFLCLSDSCEIETKTISQDDYQYTIRSGQVAFIPSLEALPEGQAITLAQKRAVQAMLAVLGGYDCQEEWGEGNICYGEGDVIPLVRDYPTLFALSYANGLGIPAENLHLERSFQASYYQVGDQDRIYFRCVAENCTLDLTDSPGKVLQGKFAVTYANFP